MILNEGVIIKNAGMVLLNAYFSLLFERLGLTENHNFKNEEFQLQAVHFLQYLASGMERTEAQYLVLNKVLCGIPITAPIQDAIEISEDQKKLMDGLIGAAINYWPAIGETSIDGFRDNWLIRDGILKEEEDYLELTVEKRAYDLLMERSPFNFSVIKLPWMLKPLRVNWEY